MNTNQQWALLSLVVCSICLFGINMTGAEPGVPEPGSSVVVVYNSRMPDSKDVAEYYASKRGVPEKQIFGFDLPITEAMSREEFSKKLQTPLWQKLESSRLIELAAATNIVVAPPMATPRRITKSAFRYLVLCYGVPTRIMRDTNLVEAGAAQMPEVLRRNEASVDSDLACLPLMEYMQWTGVNLNNFFRSTNAALMHPANGILLVTRLDGPTPAIARGLVDKAMQAETNGLWGRAYIDARGINEGGYKSGDDMLKLSAALSRGWGFETELDEKPNTFSAGYPMSHVAVYAGWYDWHVSGPFKAGLVEFMPGAFAYHLHSFSAQILRTTNQHWVGPLLAKGATITLGSVDEPYLQFTPDIAIFLHRFIYQGFSFGEAAYAAQNAVSWQNIAIGDPLYRPFARDPVRLAEELTRQGSKLADLCQLRAVNLQRAKGSDPEDLVRTLDRLRLTRQSAVLMEKLADYYWASRRLSDALDAYEQALKLEPTPVQRVRLLLTLAEKKTAYGPDKAGYDAYEKFLREVPNFPEPLPIYEKLLKLAQNLDRKEDAARYQQMIDKLKPAPPASPKK